MAFRGEIYAWDGSKATGSALYESAAVSTTNGSAFEVVTFTTGGTTVVAGQQYVLFASSSKDNAGHSGSGHWGTTFTNTPIVPGQFVFLNNGVSVIAWTTNTWSTFPQDLAMTATFDDPVAAPTGAPTGAEWAMVLIAAGIIVIASRGPASARAS